MSYTVSENQMLATMVAVLKDDGKTELANILSVSKFNYAPQWEFSGIISYQKKLYSNLKVPIAFRSIVKDALADLSKLLVAYMKMMMLIIIWELTKSVIWQLISRR